MKIASDLGVKPNFKAVNQKYLKMAQKSYEGYGNNNTSEDRIEIKEQ